MHVVICIPGLGGSMEFLENATAEWSRYGVEAVPYSVDWYDGERFMYKLHRLKQFTDQFFDREENVSVLGCSAGGSMALNLFRYRSRKLHCAINVCGRLAKGDYGGLHSFSSRTKQSLAFAESVAFFEEQKILFTDEERRRIMTVRPRFGDELVPAKTVSMDGACNVVIPSIEHVASIYLALTVFKGRIINFLNAA